MFLNQEITAINLSNLPVVYKLCRMAKIMESVNSQTIWREDNTKVSPGFLIESLVISTLSNRKPLWKMHEFWLQEELDFFYPELKIDVDWLSDDSYARALDKFSETEMKLLVSKIAIEMLKLHNLGISAIHLDTTSKSVQGAYKNPATGEFEITYGYSKDNQPNLKQYKIGCAVQQSGLPVAGDLLAGNHADSKWNPQAIREMNKFFEKEGFLDVTFIGDSATVSSYESLSLLKGLKFISRLPETFGIASELKQLAYKEDCFTEAGRLSAKDTSSEYKVAGFTRELDGSFYRFVVVHSSALAQKKDETQKRNQEKTKERLQKKAATLMKHAYACEPDALEALHTLMKEVETLGFECGGHVDLIETKAKTTKRGRPKATENRDIEFNYYACLELSGPNMLLFGDKLKEDATFVLISSIIQENTDSDITLLKEYKQQNSVEEAFRFLKSPVYLGQTLLNKKERVEAMGYVFILVLMVASYLQYRVRESLAEANEYVLDPGNKKNTRPSVKRIFEILENVLVMVTPQGRFFPSNINPRILKMIEWAGFDPRIYLKN